MGKTRVCGGRCHQAVGATCRCWRGGLFHGAAGKGSREAFAEQFKCRTLPTTEKAFAEETGVRDLFSDAGAGETWRSAVRVAVTARAESFARRAAAKASGGIACLRLSLHRWHHE